MSTVQSMTRLVSGQHTVSSSSSCTTTEIPTLGCQAPRKDMTVTLRHAHLLRLQKPHICDHRLLALKISAHTHIHSVTTASHIHL